jgi:hypothetical protein
MSVDKEIVAAINDLRAETTALRLLMSVTMRQVAGGATDWRERFEVMRGVAERGVQKLSVDDPDGQFRQAVGQHVEALLLGTYDSLVRWEKDGKPNL